MAALLSSSRSSSSQKTNQVPSHVFKEQIGMIENTLTSRLGSLKFACRALGITQAQMTRSNLSELYCLLEDQNEDIAPSLMYQLLVRIDCHQWQLDKVHSLKAQHEQSPYDINTNNSQLDLRLTLAEIVREMEDDNYEQFKQLICSSPSFYHIHDPECIASPYDLLQLLLDKEDPPNFGLILDWLEACHCSKYKENILKYCKRQNLPEPVSHLNDGKKGFVVDDRVHDNRKTCPYTCICDYKCILLAFLNVVVILIFCGILSAFLNFQIPYFTNSDSPFSSLYYGANATVFIGNFPVSSIRSVTIDTNHSIDIHMIPANSDNNTRTVILHNKPVIPPDIGYIYNDNRSLFMNYYGDNMPLYTAKRGFIRYIINFVSYGKDTPCPLQLVAFTTHSLFHQFLSPPYPSKVPPGAYNNTTCIHGNTTLNYTFILEGNSFYYFALSHVPNISFTVNASGEISEYHINNNKSIAATTTCSGNSLCHTQISDYNFETLDAKEWSLYVTSNSMIQNQLLLSVVRVSWTILGLSLLAAGFVCILVFLGCVCIHCCVSCKKKSPYRPVSTESRSTNSIDNSI